MKRFLLWACAVIIAALLSPFIMGPLTVRALFECLPLGWWHFLKRNVTHLGLNWTVIASGIFCSLILLGLGHLLFRALYRQAQQLQPERPSRSWRTRWTASIYLCVWLLFIIAFGAGGAFRHIVWLSEEPGPWFEPRNNTWIELRMAELSVRELLLDEGDDLRKTQEGLCAIEPRTGRGLFCERFNVLLFANATNGVVAYVIVPREPQPIQRGLFLVAMPDEPSSIHLLERLPSTLAMLETNYPACSR